MGETGSGKTTLLDAFVNYLDGVEFQDNWRWKLVDENHFSNKKSSESQITAITYYYVNDHVPINIRIIDTPGLGDTAGVVQDNENIKKLENSFKEINEIDYVLVTVKASETRWTKSNQYLYDRLQEVFGADAKDRFIWPTTTC